MYNVARLSDKDYMQSFQIIKSLLILSYFFTNNIKKDLQY